MNPFNLRGPEFLLFYLVLALFTWVGLEVWQRLARPKSKGDRLLRDPYLIAGLRGGEHEIVQVAVFSLLAQGVASSAAGREIALLAKELPGGLDPLQRVVVLALKEGPRTMERLRRDPLVAGEARRHLQALEAAGLLPSEAQLHTRAVVGQLAALFLVGVAAVKLVLAWQRGRSNVLFLIVLAGLSAWGFTAWGRARRRTPEGSRLLADLRGLFGARRARCPRTPSPGAVSDLVLLAAVGGMEGAPFRTRAARSNSGSTGCGAGSVGCGSDGGSGCGGSCGGGCGGCGS